MGYLFMGYLPTYLPTYDLPPYLPRGYLEGDILFTIK
jgi:hypothetical protein